MSNTYISEDLTWSHNTQQILRKSQQRLNFYEKAEEIWQATEILSDFTDVRVESVIDSSITVWFGSCSD